MHVEKGINEITNKPPIDRTAANTRDHTDLTISLLFPSYFYTNLKNKQTQTSLEEEMQKMSAEFREGKTAGEIHPHPMSMNEEQGQNKSLKGRETCHRLKRDEN